MKYMKLIQVVFVLLFACACGDGAKKTDTIELAFRFPAGTQYSYVTDSRQEIVQVTAGVNTEIKQEMRLSASYSVSAAGGQQQEAYRRL